MDYGTAINTYFAAAPDEPPRISPVVDAGPTRRLRDALEPIGAHAIWARETNERCTELGLDFTTGYVYGRAAPLGDVPSAVAVAAFGVYAPDAVAGPYEQARSGADRTAVLQAREDGTVASLRRILGDVDEAQVDEVVAVLRRGLQTADATARPLFSALSALPWPADPLGRLWRACELFREHRLGGHLAVCVTGRLSPVQMNLLTELYCGMPFGSHTATRGWEADQVAAAAKALQADGVLGGQELTEIGHAQRQDLERRTDGTQRAVLEAIGDDVDLVVQRCQVWSQAVIDAGGFPHDPYKRAAG